MSFFDDDERDPFDSIVREFFGGAPAKRRAREDFIQGEDEDRVIDFVEDKDRVYVVFELQGYNEKDVSVAVKNGALEVSAQKNGREDTQEYLSQKFRQGVKILKKLPKFINPKKFSHTVRNGILEVAFDKIGGKR